MTAAAFWSRGVDATPVTTGAAEVMDASDIREVAAALGLALPFGRVLDVGCGTGRLAALCRDHVGVDVSPDAVAYCLQRGLEVDLTKTPEDLPVGPFDLVACLSVFTHISPAERIAYLRAFHARTAVVLVDILPGLAHGDRAAWWTPPRDFEAHARAAGWRVVGWAERTTPRGFTHRHYLLRSAA